MNFLPEDYQAPKNSNNYMKLQDGDNKIRILTKPILGWEDWIETKPVRYRFDSKPAKSHDPKKPLRHFWAFVVWNYAIERIQILQITQASIRSNIEVLCKDADWGEPYFYDIKINRKGEGKDTEYTVNPAPHKAIDPKVIEQFKENACNLDALFVNGDPFSKEWDIYTQGFFEMGFAEPEAAQKSAFISDVQVKELADIFSKCEPSYKTQVISHLKKANAAIDSLQKIPADLFERIKNAALKKSESGDFAHA